MKPELKITTPFDHDDRDPRAKMIRETSRFLSLVLANPRLLERMPNLPRHRVGQEGKRWTRGFSYVYYGKLLAFLKKLTV